jgi:hypothetical protein
VNGSPLFPVSNGIVWIYAVCCYFIWYC